MTTNKGMATKKVSAQVFEKGLWTICFGKLQPPKRKPGRPAQEVKHLFEVVAEKLPLEALAAVEKHLKATDPTSVFKGVYVAHDSMGCPRYIGRGDIFARLATRKKEPPRELEYFSFYVVAEKKHEREVETLLVRAAGFLLEFNERKKRVGVAPGDVRDFEAGTVFYERQLKRGEKTYFQ